MDKGYRRVAGGQDLVGESCHDACVRSSEEKAIVCAEGQVVEVEVKLAVIRGEY